MEEFTSVEVRLLSRIRELGLKQLDICQQTGLSTTAVSNYCTGKRLPDTLSLYKIATVLKVSMEWILTGENRTNEDLQEEALSDKLIKEKQSLSCDGSPLSDEETDLVAMFRMLPDYQQEDAFDMIYYKYKKHVERKMESIYWTYAAETEKAKPTAAEVGSQSVIA